MEKKFNQKEYINNWKKQHKAQFKVDLNKDEKEELDKLLEEKGITKAQFLRDSIKQLKEDSNVR